jgi:hypothetical protein
MAAGKAIGEFSLKIVTMTITSGPAGSVLNQVNLEGTATDLERSSKRPPSPAAPRTGPSASPGRHSSTTTKVSPA